MFRLSLHAYHFSFASGISSTIDGQVRAGDVRRFWTGYERHQRGDLVNTPIAVARRVGLLRCRPIAGSRIQIGVDRTRLNVVDCDAPAPELSRQRLTKYFYGSLCGRVGHEARCHDTLAQAGTDRDYATPTLHVL